MNLIDLFLFGKKNDNYVIDSSTFSESTSEHRYTVPANKRWFLIGGYADPDQNATVGVAIYDSSDQKLLNLAYAGAGTALVSYPQSTASTNVPQLSLPIVMDAGDYLAVVFGAAQAGAAEITCVVIEVNM